MTAAPGDTGQAYRARRIARRAVLLILLGGAVYLLLVPLGGLAWCAERASHRYLREACVWNLSHVDSRAAAALIAALDDADKDVRYAAAVRLREFPGDRDVAPALLAALGDPEPLVRSGSVWSLGVIGAPATLEAILACADDPAPPVRAAVASVMAYYADPRGVPILEVLLHDEDSDVRQRAADSLATLQPPPG